MYAGKIPPDITLNNEGAVDAKDLPRASCVVVSVDHKTIAQTQRHYAASLSYIPLVPVLSVTSVDVDMFCAVCTCSVLYVLDRIYPCVQEENKESAI